MDGINPATIASHWQPALSTFRSQRASHLLY
jgi:hypothetical protein